MTPWRDSPKLLFPHRKNVGGKSSFGIKIRIPLLPRGKCLQYSTKGARVFAQFDGGSKEGERGMKKWPLFHFPLLYIQAAAVAHYYTVL